MVIFTTIMGVFHKITLETFPMIFVVFLEIIIGKVSKVFMGTEAKCLWGRRLSTGTEALHGDGGFPRGRGLSTGTGGFYTRKGTYDNDVPWGTDIEFLLRYENSRFFCDDIWFFGFLREKISKILISIQEILILIAMTA